MPISALLAERANREIKRRTDVVQCFPGRESLLRLVGAVLVEENIRWQQLRMFSEASIASVDSFVAPSRRSGRRPKLGRRRGKLSRRPL